MLSGYVWDVLMGAGLVPGGKPLALGPNQGQAPPLVLVLALDSCPSSLLHGLVRVRVHEPRRPLFQYGLDGGCHGEGSVAEGCLQRQLLSPVHGAGIVVGTGANTAQAAAREHVLSVREGDMSLH